MHPPVSSPMICISLWSSPNALGPDSPDQYHVSFVNKWCQAFSLPSSVLNLPCPKLGSSFLPFQIPITVSPPTHSPPSVILLVPLLSPFCAKKLQWLNSGTIWEKQNFLYRFRSISEFPVSMHALWIYPEVLSLLPLLLHLQLRLTWVISLIFIFWLKLYPLSFFKSRHSF